MIETRQMTVEDYLLVMEQNAEAYPEWEKMSDEQKMREANLHIVMGTAQSFYEDGRLVGVGGIAFKGIGEGWLITPPSIRRDRPKSLLKKAKEVLLQTRDEHGLCRIFATSKISKNFLKHLGFNEVPEVFCWTRERRPNGNER